MINVWGTVTVLGYLLTLVLIPWVLLLKKRQPVSTIAWIVSIVMLPGVGGLLFLFFGINRVERRAFRKQLASRVVSRHVPELSQHQILSAEVKDAQQQRLIRLASSISGTVPTMGNRIEVLADTNRTLGLIEQAILSAKSTLHLEYYIWQPDRTGTRIRDLLIK